MFAETHVQESERGVPVATVDHNRPVLPVPYSLEVPDRAPKQRYYDPDFFQMEVDQLWSRTWQMACRLEEIPRPHDYVTYEVVGQSVVVVRARNPALFAIRSIIARDTVSWPMAYVCFRRSTERSMP